MSLKEKIGQCLFIHFEGEDVNSQIEQLLSEIKAGGIILYDKTNGLKSPEKTKRLCYNLQDLARRLNLLPLFVCIDQEGGRVSRLKQGFTQFAGNAALGNIGEPQLAYETGKTIGKELKNVGIQVNLAPVIDVNNNPHNPIIGPRSFGDNPEIVTQMGRAMLKGFKDSGIIPCLKHFPGHGDVTIDSHLGLPIVNKTMPELQKIELAPFANLCHESPMIMTAHILFPQLDPDHCATLSEKILKGILIDQMQYHGLLITDSLVMKGVLDHPDNLGEVMVQAFLAGNDILLLGGWYPSFDVKGPDHLHYTLQAYRYFLNAVKTGRITEKRLDQSIAKISALR